MMNKEKRTYSREESLNIIKTAYETGKLGFQKNAQACRYYDSDSDSCCVIGVLLDLSKCPRDKYNNVSSLVHNSKSMDHDIESVMIRFNISKFMGFSRFEVSKLQIFHDHCVNYYSSEHEKIFMEYIYSL